MKKIVLVGILAFASTLTFAQEKKTPEKKVATPKTVPAPEKTNRKRPGASIQSTSSSKKKSEATEPKKKKKKTSGN